MMVKAMTVPWLVVGTLICEGMVKNGASPGPVSPMLLHGLGIILPSRLTRFLFCTRSPVVLIRNGQVVML